MTLDATIAEQIVDELVERLERITLENDFAFDVAAVEQPNRTGKTPSYKPRSIVVLPDDAIRDEELDLPGNPPAIAYRLDVRVVAIGSHSDTSTDPAHQDARRVAGTAVVAITTPATNPHRWYTFGELAIDAEIGDQTPIASPQATLSAYAFTVSITFRVDENDPFTARA